LKLAPWQQIANDLPCPDKRAYPSHQISTIELFTGHVPAKLFNSIVDFFECNLDSIGQVITLKT
jgi:hypothetical protein